MNSHEQSLARLRVQYFQERGKRLERIQQKIVEMMESYHASLLNLIKQSSSHYEDWHSEILDALDNEDLLRILGHLVFLNQYQPERI